MIHNFNTKVAKEYGIPCAVLLNNIYFWVLKNRANNKHMHEGKYWTYNSVKAFTELFDYLSKGQIERSLNKLEEEGLIETSNFNDAAYDRTKWYTVTEKGEAISQICELHFSNLGNAIPENEKPIPYINTYINTDNISSEDEEKKKEEERLKENFEKIYELYPKKSTKNSAFISYKKWVQKSGRKVDGHTYHLTDRQIWYAVNKYVKEQEEKNTEQKYYKNFVTLMNQILDYVED